MREALLLDLGALVFELQRQSRREPELLQAKAAELNAVDQEVRALAHALESGQTVQELVAAGVAGSCAGCGSLLSTDARYCSACGAPAMPSLGAEGRPSPDPALDPGPPEATPTSLGIAASTPPPQPAPEPHDGPEPQAGPLGRIRGRLGRRQDGG
jgi:hypothetical protein